MGRRASMFRCHDCGNDWWEWFEWLKRGEMIQFAEDLRCPECDGIDWELTDTSEFAGGRLSGEAGYPHWMRHARDLPAARDTLGITEIQQRLDALESDSDSDND